MKEIKDLLENIRENGIMLISICFSICLVLALGKIFIEGFLYIIVITFILLFVSRIKVVAEHVKSFVKKSIVVIKKKFK